jgi:TraY domain
MPRTTRGDGKRHPLNMRTTLETRQRLEAAAAANGRSLAQEVEARLERSFVEEAALGGPEMVRLAYLMTTAFATAASRAASGNPDWASDPDAYRAGLTGVVDALLIGMPDATVENIGLLIEDLKSRLLSRVARAEGAA